MFLQTLFSTRGCDNRYRFSSISALCYLLLLGFGMYVSAAWLALIAVPLATALQLSALRRGHDAGLRSRAIVFILLPFLVVFITLVTDVEWLAWLLTGVLALPLSLILARLAPADAMADVHYHWGFWSEQMPSVDNTPRPRAARVEPVVGVASGAVESQDPQAYDDPMPDDPLVMTVPEAVDVEPEQAQHYRREMRRQGSLSALLAPVLEPITHYLQPRLPTLTPWILGISAGVVVLAAGGYWLAMSPKDSQRQPAQPIAPKVDTSARVALPDGFYLQLDQGQLLLQWFGETKHVGELWSLTTAQGDKRCSQLVFNNGNQYRPLVVTVEANSLTQARFSPLDSDQIIEDVAYRGQLSVCGYQFALKGTQAVLESSPEFARALK
ncbi:hypothetical protein [Shewanella sp. NIFS-20-20]|uniref:hypothetical protein n=1 Tax=Shewanella sp. NIFS-20-20 TaxID=2853806 RepID=UPI001C470DD7|nr:hypothetical protein [Shewanella sp. NIFS-20-20]MBV7315390.1 hypothetical protein [Shewanella sp. NIFS-20-20]